MSSDVIKLSPTLPRAWSGYNNAGIAAVAIGCVLNHMQSLTLAKALLVMPIVMHSETTKFLASERHAPERLPRWSLSVPIL